MASERNSGYNESKRRLDTSLTSDRASSFHNNAARWPASLPSADSMAEAGFYFTPTDKNADCTTCFRCGIKMYNWLPDDTPKSEHKKFSPSCKEVKSWNNVVVEDDRHIINRAEQTHDSLRSKLAGKAKKLTGTLRSKHEKNVDPMSSFTKEPVVQDQRVLNEEEKLADIRRQREVAEKSLDGLKKLASFYTIGSVEHKRAEQSIVLQTTDLEKLRQEEEELSSKMGNLSFGRSWGNNTVESPETQPYNKYSNAQVSYDEESPEPVVRGRSQTRPLPVLPSQMRKNSMPKMPTRLQKPNESELQSTLPSLQSESISQSAPPTYEQFNTPKQSEWIEYFTEAGIPYYYSTITKTTVWQIPEQSRSEEPNTKLVM